MRRGTYPQVSPQAQDLMARPVAVVPAPVYVQPAPVYVQRSPVVVTAPYPGQVYYRGYYRHGWPHRARQWKHHHYND